MRRGWIVGGLLALAVALAGWFFASPILAANALQAALRAGDRDKLEQLVDFPAVREGLKADLGAVMIAKMENDPDLRDNPFASLGKVLIPALTDRIVDAAVTPDGLVRLSRGEELEIRPQGDEPEPRAAPAASSESPKLSYGYRGLNRFVAVQRTGEGELTWVMERQGLFGWRLTRIELPTTAMTETGAKP